MMFAGWVTGTTEEENILVLRGLRQSMRLELAAGYLALQIDENSRARSTVGDTEEEKSKSQKKNRHRG